MSTPKTNSTKDYTVPSTEVPTIKLHGDYINALYADFPYPKHKLPRGRLHANGTCGGIYGLCGLCEDIQEEWHKEVARAIAKQTPPHPDESCHDYWIRVRGRMLDTWCDAAYEALRVSKTAAGRKPIPAL